MTNILSKENRWFIVGNSVFALLLFFLVQKIYLLPAHDSKAFFLGPIIKNTLFSDAMTTPSHDVLLVNTHYDNALTKNYDQYTTEKGNLVIVDREKLIKLFTKLKASNSYNYIICDIVFEDSTAYDDDLAKILKTTERIVIPRKNSLSTSLKPYRDINSGLVDAYTAGGVFYKYELYNRRLDFKSMPLTIYEDLHKTTYTDYFFFGSLDGALVFNDFVPEHYINNYNVFETRTYPLVNLGDLIKANTTFDSYVRDKLVVVGNFNTDTKGTLYGDIPGPLIVTNTYLNLEHGKHKITAGLMVCLLLIFAAFSFVILLPKTHFENVVLQIPVIGGLLLGFSFVFTMGILALLLYGIFNVNLNLTYIALVFYLQNLIYHRKAYWERFKKKLKSKTETL
ncbi:CHASE2 domain-containing protein [Psychroserpens sp. MEBiC05023]